MRKRKQRTKSLIHFRSWSRKKHAAFASMKRVIKICTLCIAYSLVTMPGKTQAQNKSNDSLQAKSYELDDVVVTAERTPVEAQQTARIVQVITKAEIERAPAQNLSDLLRFIAGADIRQRGPLGAQADISIRGGTYEQTLILLNGVNVNDPQTGHHNLNLPIDIESIERIEILEGPAAKSFGPNAFNGVINIITGNSNPNHIRASALYGQNGLYKVSGNISNTLGKFHHFLSMNKMSSNGYMYNTGYAATNVFYQADYNAKIGKIDFQTGYNNKEFGANGFYELSLPNQYEYTKTEFASLKFQSNTRIKFAPILYLRRHRDDFEWDKISNTSSTNHHLTTTGGLNLNVWTTCKLGKTSIGADIRNEGIISNSYGHAITDSIPVPYFDSAFYNKRYSRFLMSYYLEHSITIGIFNFSGGVMMHQNSNMKTPGLFPGIDISAKLGSHLKLYATTSKTLRMPSYTEMFLQNRYYQGNENLKPEEAINIEGGLKTNNKIINGTISVFQKWGSNSIDWVKDSTAGKWKSVNHSNVIYKGFTTSLNITPGEITGNRINAIRLSYSFLTADTVKKYYTSKYVLDYLRHQITGSIDHRIIYKLNASWRISYLDRSGEFTDVNKVLVSYKPFWLADARIYWKDKHYTIYTEASNLFNVSYFDFGGITQPGIWIKGGIIIDLDYRKIDSD